MSSLGESQQHLLQGIRESLVELRRLIDAQTKSIRPARFEQQSWIEEPPDSHYARSPQLLPWPTRPPDASRQRRALPSRNSNSPVQPPQSKAASSTRTWRPPPSRTTGDFVPCFGLRAPLFNGDDPLGWIFGIQEYYNHYLISESTQLELVDRLIEYPASNWFCCYQKNNTGGSWEDFLVALRNHFAPDLIEDEVSQVVDENHLVSQSLITESNNIVAHGMSSCLNINPIKPAENRELISDDSYALDGRLEAVRHQFTSELTEEEVSWVVDEEQEVHASHLSGCSFNIVDHSPPRPSVMTERVEVSKSPNSLSNHSASPVTDGIKIKCDDEDDMQLSGSMLCVSTPDNALDIHRFTPELQEEVSQNVALEWVADKIPSNINAPVGGSVYVGDAPVGGSVYAMTTSHPNPEIPCITDDKYSNVVGELITSGAYTLGSSSILELEKDLFDLGELREKFDTSSVLLLLPVNLEAENKSSLWEVMNSKTLKASFCRDAKWSLQLDANNGLHIFDPGDIEPHDSLFVTKLLRNNQWWLVQLSSSQGGNIGLFDDDGDHPLKGSCISHSNVKILESDSSVNDYVDFAYFGGIDASCGIVCRHLYMTTTTLYAEKTSHNNDLLVRFLLATIGDYAELVESPIFAADHYRFVYRHPLLLGTRLDQSEVSNREVDSSLLHVLLHEAIDNILEVIGDGYNFEGGRIWAAAAWRMFEGVVFNIFDEAGQVSQMIQAPLQRGSSIEENIRGTPSAVTDPALNLASASAEEWLDVQIALEMARLEAKQLSAEEAYVAARSKTMSVASILSFRTWSYKIDLMLHFRHLRLEDKAVFLGGGVDRDSYHTSNDSSPSNQARPISSSTAASTICNIFLFTISF